MLARRKTRDSKAATTRSGRASSGSSAMESSDVLQCVVRSRGPSPPDVLLLPVLGALREGVGSPLAPSIRGLLVLCTLQGAASRRRARSPRVGNRNARGAGSLRCGFPRLPALKRRELALGPPPLSSGAHLSLSAAAQCPGKRVTPPC
ncbi:hypothetical protein NDU88_001474 [Pleurodeles waltl]|uniref:Uncharacterized protein n=1 Tax=Pleurodeles waltl TaxID=8319 RepID=A0AAV7WIF1_PLEWA|nr:hypothetical protein NDU88_001474 [Pleurodeles waltl]